MATLLTQAQPRAHIFEQSRKLGRGINVLGYDDRAWQSRERGRFQPKHFRLLKEAGFNSVRINLHPFRHLSETNGWTLEPEWLAALDGFVGLAREQQLMIILDLHEFTPMGKDPEANKPRFLAVWRELSAHYQNAPPDVFFEVLNEPFGKLTPALWNDYFREALALIREKNPNRAVIVGPGNWNSIDRLPELDLPASDRNLLVTVHYYQPFSFTHQGTSWTDRKDKTGVDWPGSEADRKAIRDDFKRASAWAKEHDRPLFLGEFGAYEVADMAARARYVDAVARTAEAESWSWAYWQFDRDFAAFDTQKDRWVEPILRALIPPAAGPSGTPRP